MANLNLGEGALILQRTSVRGTLGLIDLKKPEALSLLDLRSASTSTYDHPPVSCPRPNTLLLDGFRYSSFGPSFPVNQCVQWLRQSNPLPLSLQPYEQAARVLNDSGYETEAKQTLIAKSEDLLKYGALTWWQRLSNYWLGLTVGYGYRSHRALFIMAYIIFMGAGIFHDGERNHLMVKTNTSWASDVSKSNYPKFQTFLYSMDTFLPILNLGQKDYWAPNAKIGLVAEFPLTPSFVFKFTWGSALRTYLILHIILGWIFTTLWVAGLVRKLN